MGWIIPLLASVISLYLALSLIGKWRGSRKASVFWFAISLILFTVASFTEFYADAFGWLIPIYKIYYFVAISLVAYMAAGTVYILAKEKSWMGHLYIAYTVIVTLFFLIKVIGAEVDKTLLTNATFTIAGGAMPSTVRLYSILLSAVGGILLIFGALYSYWRTRYVGHLYIAAGAIVLSIGGKMAKTGLIYFLPLSELIGIILLYYGVVRTASKNPSEQLNNSHVKGIE